jgi:hypothetical protein
LQQGVAGVYWSNPPAVFVSNTVIDGSASGGSTIATDDFGTPVTVANNIIVAIHGATNALSCGFTDILNPSTFYNNDVFSANGPAYGGICTDQTTKGECVETSRLTRRSQAAVTFD